MLTGDFTDMGWENVRAMDWREAFYSTVAETLEAGLEACSESSPQNAGYHMGRFVGEALRLTSDPQQPTRIGKSLKSEFLRQLVSEYPMGFPPSTQTFPYRNRIVAGWGRGLLVVEAGLKSGALITADQAIEAGR